MPGNIFDHTFSASGVSSTLSRPLQPENMCLQVSGSLGGGTLTSQVSWDGVNWVTADTFATTDKAYIVTIPAQFTRFNLAGATSPAVRLVIH